MYATFTTNAATMTTLVVLWSMLSAIATYLFMENRYRNLREDLEVMDYHLGLANDTIEDLLRQGNENEVVDMIDGWS